MDALILKSISFPFSFLSHCDRILCIVGGGCLRRRPLSHDARQLSPWRPERLFGRSALEASVSVSGTRRQTMLQPVGDAQGLRGPEADQVGVLCCLLFFIIFWIRSRVKQRHQAAALSGVNKVWKSLVEKVHAVVTTLEMKSLFNVLLKYRSSSNQLSGPRDWTGLSSAQPPQRRRRPVLLHRIVLSFSFSVSPDTDSLFKLLNPNRKHCVVTAPLSLCPLAALCSWCPLPVSWRHRSLRFSASPWILKASCRARPPPPAVSTFILLL